MDHCAFEPTLFPQVITRAFTSTTFYRGYVLGKGLAWILVFVCLLDGCSSLFDSCHRKFGYPYIHSQGEPVYPFL